ncbi:MAG TPA: PTS fructose-like transporter subunit IIB [Acidimicrobiales bacterium]|nr:PTS fructose-like transporter subunit IIB [Acidimicrobiales bacterium]
MRFVAVTACPTGVAHTLMAAEALRRQAQVMGHEIEVETQGAEGTKHPLTADAIARSDAVIIAADIHVDPARFAGKSVRAVTTADAIRHTRDVLESATASTYDPDDTLPEADRAVAAIPAAADGGQRRIVAVTSCPTGIAHTFMAAEGLLRAAESLGHSIKVETQGSVGAKNVLTAEEIAAADAVVIAADTKVDLSRFVGKPVHETGTKDALKHGTDVVQQALSPSTPVLGPGGRGGDGDRPTAREAAAAGAARGGEPATLKQLYQHLMTGVSHMLPLIVAGGLLIAISFAVDIDANDPAMADSLAGRFFQLGGFAFALFLPVLAGYIAYSIADRPGLAPGLIGGYLAGEVETGFLGAILAGFLAGYLTRWLATNIRLPQTLAGLKPVLILPLLSTLAVGMAMFYVIGEPVSWVQSQLTDWLEGLQGRNAALLGAILGLMMAFDMGGPLNKVAYTFAVGLIDADLTAPMAAVMAAGMTPPLGLALATVLFPSAWLPEEREAGKPAFVLGLAFITEGAIPFAARDPMRVIPAAMVGSALAGAISLGLDAGSIVPHGGILDLFVPNAINNVGAWALAIAVGTIATTSVLFATKRVRAPARVRPEPALAA